MSRRSAHGSSAPDLRGSSPLARDLVSIAENPTLEDSFPSHTIAIYPSSTGYTFKSIRIIIKLPIPQQACLRPMTITITVNASI